MKLVYFHGFGSSHASGTVETLRRELPNDEVVGYEYGWYVCPADAWIHTYFGEPCLYDVHQFEGVKNG